MSELVYFGISKPGTNEINNQQACTNYSNEYSLTLDGCNNARNDLSLTLAANCFNIKSCNISFNFFNYSLDCFTTDLSSNVYVSYKCYQGYIQIPYGNAIERSMFGYIVVIIDIVSMIVLIITLVM